jgi:hypothetical protein
VRVGIVCEGSTDFAVLRVLCGELLGTTDLFVTLLQPRFDALAGRAGGAPGPGWQGVRAFLQQTGGKLAAAGQDVIVVHVDADIRHLPEVEKLLRESEDGEELGSLCDLVKTWMPGGVPASVVIVLPREATEAWLCAVASTIHRADVEDIRKPADALRDAGVVGDLGGTAEKRALQYAALAAGLGALLRDRRKLAKVPEMERFVGKLAARARAVTRAARGGRGRSERR